MELSILLLALQVDAGDPSLVRTDLVATVLARQEGDEQPGAIGGQSQGFGHIGIGELAFNGAPSSS